MSAAIVIPMVDVVGRKVEAASWSEIISHQLFSGFNAPPVPVKPEGVTTELRFDSGLCDTFAAAAA